MASISSKGKKPGPQQPEKYGGNVGPRYQKWGEQPGFVYIPSRDEYWENTKELEQQLIDSGAVDAPPKPPGLFETVAPVAGGAAALYAGKQIGERVFSKEGYDAAKSALGFGTPAVSETATGMGPFANPSAYRPSVGPSGMFADSSGVATPTGLQASRPSTVLPPGSTSGPNGEILAPDGNVVDPNSGANLGRWAQGAGGAILVYQGLQQWQQGDKVGGGLGMFAGGANIAAALGSETAKSIAGPAGAVYGAYTIGDMALNGGDVYRSDTGRNAAKGATAGAALGSVIPGVGTAIGAVIGGTFGAIQGLTGSSKGGMQLARDGYREYILENKVPLFDENYQGTLADGSTFDFGKDKFGFGEGEGEINLKDPATGKAAAYGNVLASIQGATGKGREALATQFLAAANSNANGDLGTVQANYQHFFNKLGVDRNIAQQGLDRAKEEGKISEEEYSVFTNDLNEILGPGGSAPTQPTAANTRGGLVGQLPLGSPEQVKASGMFQTPNQPMVIPGGISPDAYVPYGPPAQAAMDKVVIPQARSKTRSPGIDLEGNRISY